MPEEEDLGRWGIAHLDTLLAHYGQPRENVHHQMFPALVCPETCRQEFLTFKRLVYRNRTTADVINGHPVERLLRPPELFARLFGNVDNIHLYQGTIMFSFVSVVFTSLQT